MPKVQAGKSANGVIAKGGFTCVREETVTR